MPASRPVKRKNTKSKAAGCKPARAMILAAGLGKRMRPITKKTPKPLIKVAGRMLLDWTLDRFEDAGVKKVVVNTHHFAKRIEQHLGKRKSPEILLSPEDQLLDTGGGVAQALPRLGRKPFFVANGDVLWLNGLNSALGRMAGAWDDGKMDALLLLHFTVDGHGYAGWGDFCVDPDGLLARRPERELSPYYFSGVQILHPRLFKGAPEGPFSLNLLYDRAIDKERLHGIVHDGEVFHIGTPEGLAEAEAYMRVRYAGKERR